MVHRLVDRGVYFSISFTILDKYKDKIPPWKDMRAAAKAVPSDLLLTETDGINPERMPFSTLNDVVKTLAALRSSSPEEATAQVRNNFVNVRETKRAS
jgi:Tat protein secretion system quality control protein TatD with DNase activity